MQNEHLPRGRSRSYQHSAEAPRPASHAASDAFAFGIATEAMRNAAEAMTRAAQAMDARNSVNVHLQTLSPATSIDREAALRPDIPWRSSSMEGSLEKPPAAFLGRENGGSGKGSLKTPLETFPRRQQEREKSHVDLLEAANMQDMRNEKGYSRYSGKSYGEDVADRNMGVPYDTRSRSSSIPLAAPSTPPLSSFDPEPPEEEGHGHGHSMSLPHEIMFIAVICQAQLLTQAALAQTIAPLPYIARTFNANNNPSSLAWYSAGYALTVGTFILPSGRLGDVYGHKLLFIIGWVWFALSSLLCGFAPMVQQSPADMDGSIFFVVSRALQGIGPAIVMPNGLALMGTTYAPGKKKNMLFALFGACAPAGFVIGATFSSLFAQKGGGWEIGFWVMAGVCGALALLTIIFIPAPHHALPSTSSAPNEPRPSLITRLKATATTLDLSGSALGVTALLLINIALNQAPLVGWSTPYTYFLLLLGVLFLLFFLYQQRHAASPLIPSSLLNRATVFVLICTACGWASMGIWIFYIWSYMERLHLLSPLLASAWFAPAPVAGCLASVVTGFGLSKGMPQWVMLASMIAFCLGTTLISTADPDRSYWVGVFFSVFVMPFGMDMSFPSATLLVSDSAGRGSQGMAASVVNTVVNYSISIGLGLAGTVVREIGADRVDPGEIENKELLRGFRSAWWTGMGLSGTGIIVAAIFCVVVHFEQRKRVGAGREKR